MSMPAVPTPRLIMQDDQGHISTCSILQGKGANNLIANFLEQNPKGQILAYYPSSEKTLLWTWDDGLPVSEVLDPCHEKHPLLAYAW